MRINNNVMALNAHRQLAVNQSNAAKSMERLSSGLRINRAADDAAGLAISEKMRAQVRGLKQASRNAQDGISLIQTAEGALNETHAILQRMRELANQAATDTNTDDDRAELQKEITDLLAEVDRISSDTNFNTKTLLNGDLAAGFALEGEFTNAVNVAGVSVADGTPTAGATLDVTQTVTYGTESSTGANDGAFLKIEIKVQNQTVEFTKAEIDGGTIEKTVTVDGVDYTVTLADATALSASTGNGAVAETTPDSLTVAEKTGLTFHIGANSGESITLAFSDMSSTGLNINGIDISTQDGADTALDTLDNAIKNVSGERSKLGAAQNRLEHTISNLGTSAENLQAAESRIRDLDMAEEIMAFTKNNILQQAATAMLAQANMAPQSVLQLLG